MKPISDVSFCCVAVQKSISIIFLRSFWLDLLNFEKSGLWGGHGLTSSVRFSSFSTHFSTLVLLISTVFLFVIHSRGQSVNVCIATCTFPKIKYM